MKHKKAIATAGKAYTEALVKALRAYEEAREIALNAYIKTLTKISKGAFRGSVNSIQRQKARHLGGGFCKGRER